MKTQELMIGDWVEVIQNGEKHFAQMQMIDGYGDNATANECVCDAIYYSIDEIKPIPLTPEILEKNGFVKVFSEYWCMDEWKCRSIGTAWVDYENCIRMEIETNGVHITTPIHYIHELQHALRLFGIDKEIEL